MTGKVIPIKPTKPTGHILLLPQNGIKVPVMAVGGRVPLPRLQALVSGMIQLVPYFTDILLEQTNEVVPCRVFCDEEGKLRGKLINRHATALWVHCLERQGRALTGDYLVGDVAVLYGPEAWLRAQ
jgi:hypothetical protein